MGVGREKTGVGGGGLKPTVKLHKLVIFHIDLVILSLSFLR